jgi:hypothetical protein
VARREREKLLVYSDAKIDYLSAGAGLDVFFCSST